MGISNIASLRCRMGRFAIALLVTTLPSSALAALDIARSELESTSGAKVDFVNYVGPQSVIQSSSEIRGIGAALAASIGTPDGKSAQAGDQARYAVIRAVDPTAGSGLDADILVIGKEAAVDHIDNVRRIISGYLEGAWGYSRADAATLAVFITVYNAVHRGDIAYFSSKYKQVVMKELSADNAGLALRWDQWAGKTRLLIPLSSGAKPGAAGAVSTGTISGKEVTEGMKAEPGAGIPERQALVDIKQKEVAQSQEQAAQARSDAAAASARAAAAQTQLAEAQKNLEAAQAAAAQPTPGTAEGAQAQAPKAAEAQSQAQAPQPTTTGQESAQAAPTVAEAQRQVSEAQKAVDTAQAEAAAKTKEAQAADAVAAAKQTEIAADRQSITADQNAAIAGQVAAANASEASGVFVQEIVDAAYPYSRIDFIDGGSGKLIRASVLNSIRSRSLVDGGESFVAVAGKEGGTGAVRLVAIEKKGLTQIAQGSVDIYPESVVAKVGDSYFAVIKTAEGKYYLGRFGADLSEAARTTDEVNPFTFVVKAGDGILAQSADGGFLSLDPTSLATKGRFGN